MINEGSYLSLIRIYFEQPVILFILVMEVKFQARQLLERVDGLLTYILVICFGDKD